MPRYLIERQFSVTEEAMPELGKKSNTVIRDEAPAITWEHSHVVVGEDGLVRTFCIYEAPHEEYVLRHSDMLGAHIIAGIYEIAADVTPADFPLD